MKEITLNNLHTLRGGDRIRVTSDEVMPFTAEVIIRYVEDERVPHIRAGRDIIAIEGLLLDALPVRIYLLEG